MENFVDDYRDNEDLESLVAEIQSTREADTSPKDEITKLDPSNIKNFILENNAKTIETTQTVIGFLLKEIKCDPNPELVSSVSEMISSHTKALDNLTKLYFNDEKVKQVKEIEAFKQSIKNTVPDNALEDKPAMTRDDIIKMIASDNFKQQIREKEERTVEAEVIELEEKSE